MSSMEDFNHQLSMQADPLGVSAGGGSFSGSTSSRNPQVSMPPPVSQPSQVPQYSVQQPPEPTQQQPQQQQQSTQPQQRYNGNESNGSFTVPSSLAEENPQLVYESPLGNVVSKLRTVSLTTAIIGMTGVPCMIAIKGGVIPEVVILAAAMLFVTGSIGSAAAIHFVFAPYVYRIECIPIRQCSIDASATSSDVLPSSQKGTLLKAWTRSLFLRDSTIVFDPCIDVQPYKGTRPLCNLIAKGRPLYVHPGTFYRWTVSFQVFIC
jgi:hypothetical protein